MDWLTRMHQVIDYIEEHLTNDIDFKEVAKRACCSTYHFSSMFSAMTGFTLAEYIRRRRLSEAAVQLQKYSNVRIIDIAMKYRYDSPDAFSRAFKNLHGITPSKARQPGIQLKTIPKLSFYFSIKGDVAMDYRIERLEEEVTIVGVKQKIVTKDAFQTIPILWGEAQNSGLLQRLIELSWEKPQCKLAGILGVCGEQATIMDDTFEYWMGCRYTGEIPSDMEKMIVPISTWAVFPDVSQSWKRLYTEWLPAAGYELEDYPCIENYFPPEHIPQSELWVPIRLK